MGFEVVPFIISKYYKVSLFTINKPKRPNNEQGTLHEWFFFNSYIMLIDKLKSQKTYALKENKK